MNNEKQIKSLTEIFNDAKKKGLVNEEDYRMYLNIKASFSQQSIFGGSSLIIAAMAITLTAYVSILDLFFNSLSKINIFNWEFIVPTFVFAYVVYLFKQESEKFVKDIEESHSEILSSFNDYFKWKKERKEDSCKKEVDKNE